MRGCIVDLLNLIECDPSIGNVKLIPKFLLGYDGELLSEITDGNLDKYRIDELRNLNINIEDSKGFIDKFFETQGIESYKDFSLKNFLENNLNSDMIKFLFGENIKNLDHILPINGYDGLLFYKLKTMWGDKKFKNRISTTINNGSLNQQTKGFIKNIIESGITGENLPMYLEVCTFLENKGIKGFPNLQCYIPEKNSYKLYTLEEYIKILKYMSNYYTNFAEHRITRRIYLCEILYKNNIPGNALDFFGNCNQQDYEDIISLYKELFENKNGKELYLFISKFPQKLENLGGKEIKEIELKTGTGNYNFCFRGILEMIRSRPDIKVPNLKNDGERKWKSGREKIIKEYESLLREYISLDKDKKGNEKPRNQTFDKIFFASAINHEDEDGNGALQEFPVDYIFKAFTNNFEDCSSTIDKNGKLDQNNQKNMIKKIKEYAKAHPNEKILVYLGYHGDPDGSSSNGWKQEDWVNLANISTNIKVVSSRCNFGGAYTNNNSNKKNYIYGIKSSVLGSSNNSTGYADFDKAMQEGYAKGLGFHELQIYARLNYNYSFTPLTEYMDYIDFRTGKKNHKIVGLADAGIGSGRDDIA